MPQVEGGLKLTAVRASAALTAAYVAGTVIKCGTVNHVTLGISYAMGAGETANSIEVKVEHKLYGGDGYYRKVNEADSTGTTTITLKEYTFAAVSAAETADSFTLEIPVNCESLKISVKETGKATNFGTCSILANAGVK